MIGNDGKIFGYDNSLYKSNPQSLSKEAIAWRNRIIANGGTIDNRILSIIDINLIKPMVSTGIFNCLDRLNLYASTGDRIAARTNIINDLYFVQEQNVANLEWFDNFGYSSKPFTSPQGYITMGYNPSTAAKWSADRFNCSQFVYTRYFNNLNAANLMGNGFATASRSAALQRSLNAGVSRLIVFMNNTQNNAQSNPLTIGSNRRYWLCGTRSGNIVNNIVDSEVRSFSIAPSATILNQEIAELTLLGQVASPNQFDVNSHMASGHGNNNFNNQTLRTLIINTFTALGNIF